METSKGNWPAGDVGQWLSVYLASTRLCGFDPQYRKKKKKKGTNWLNHGISKTIQPLGKCTSKYSDMKHLPGWSIK
jgi:hypothetical protein